MPYNGAGQFELVSGNPVVTGTVISSAWANNTLNDIANNGLSNALTKDGQTTPTADIRMGGFRLVDLGDAVDDTDAITFKQAKDATHLPAGYRTGGTLTLPSTTSVSIAPGSWRDTTNAADIVLAAAMTKTLQATGGWAAGSNSNGLFAGAIAVSTWYHVFAIRNPTTNVVDAGFDTSPIAANRPAGFTQFRRIGSILTTATPATIVPFVQNGHEFRFLGGFATLSNGPLPLTKTLLAVQAPPDVQTLVKIAATLQFSQVSTTIAVAFFSPDETVTAGVSQNLACLSSSSAQSFGNSGQFYVVTNTVKQIAYQGIGLASAGGLYVGVAGYLDFIGD